MLSGCLGISVRINSVLFFSHLAISLFNADRPPASSSDTSFNERIICCCSVQSVESSPKTRSAAAKNNGPLILNARQFSGNCLPSIRPSPVTSSTWVMAAISFINSSAANTIPAVIAITISNNTVNAKQVINTQTSPRGAVLIKCTALCASLIPQATITNNAAIAGIGK